MGQLLNKCAYASYKTDSFAQTIEMIDQFFMDKDQLDSEGAREKLRLIRQAVLYHLDHKRQYLNVNNSPVTGCLQKIKADQDEFISLIETIKAEQNIGGKEFLLMNWFNTRFMDSEARCITCK